jgi:7-carboxy-7-deazaguanine synthase (Cx14CxxC type)
MPYALKEIFYTLQGEGANAGRAAVFCRFAGCNLWSGREKDRASAICTFCDTDFVGTDGDGGGKFANAEDLAESIAGHWPNARGGEPFVVCTGGEPLLQLDELLIEALHRRGFFIAVETNGTVPVPKGIDWVCVSPKIGSKLVVQSGNELKLVYPQDVDPAAFVAMRFQHFFLQPKDGPDAERSVQATIAYCKAHPLWRLSVQTHKVVGIR